MLGRLRRIRAVWHRLRESPIWDLVGRQKRWVYALAVVAVLNFLIILGILDALRKSFDNAILEQTEPLGPIVSSLLGLAFLGIFTGFAQRQIIARIGYHLEYELRLQLHRRLQSIDPKLLDALPTGQLVTRAMTDLTLVELLVQLIPTLGVAVTLLSALAVLTIYLHPVMGIVALAALPINGYLINRVRKPLWGFSWLSLHRRAQVTTAIDESVRGIRVVKAFAREDEERGRVATAAARVFTVTLGRVRMMARYDLVLQAIPVVLNAILLVLAGRAIVNGEFSVGELLIFLIFTRVFTGLAQQFDEIASGWMFAKSGALRIFELLAWGDADADADADTPSAAGRKRGGLRTPPEPGTGLHLHGAEVRFGDQVSLPPVDLAVRPGELVVLTGAPGSGKSLVAAVAGGGLAPTTGQATFDGAPLTELDPRVLRSAVRVIAEEPFLFGRSVRDNLAVGAAGGRPSDARLHAALRVAAADEVVADLPEGLDAVLGDRALTLSGGQRQRLALARALVSPPEVLVLDDALSAVNPALEVEILRRLRVAAPQLAILFITRRAGAHALADRVVTLPAPVTTATPFDLQSLLLAAVAGRSDDPPDPALAEAVTALPPHAEVPDVAEEATLVDERPSLRSLLRPFAGKVAVALGFLMAFTLASLIPEGLFKIAVDDFKEGVHDDADKVALVLAALAGVLGVLAYFLKVFTARVNEGVLYLLRRRTFTRLSRLGVEYYDRELPGQVAARVVHDLDRISSFLETGVYQLAVNITIIVACVAVVLVWNPEVGMAVLAIVPLMLVLTAVQVPLAQRAYVRSRARLGEVIERFQEDVAGRYVIDGYGIAEVAARDLDRRLLALRSARRTSTSISNGYIELMQYFGWVAMAVVIDRAGNLALQGAISAGSVVALQLYLARATAPIPQLSDLLQRYLAARASFATLRQPFDAPVLPVERPEAVTCPVLTGDVVLDGVSFTYPGTGRQVLDGVSLQVPPGTSLALVGPTGAGKSSIAKLAARVYDPDAGAVLVDGHDVRDLDLRSYRRRLGVVPQDAFCFRGTVAENVAYGRPDASRDEVEAAVDGVGGTAVLARIPGGVDGFVDEEGRNLTAAQRQVLALARAVLVEPDVLVLDEATSCLDAALEASLLDALRAAGRTTIFITHRLPVARFADRVAVVDGGRIVEEGTHDELAAAGGPYARLWSTEELQPA